jgi:hypothetical protein
MFWNESRGIQVFLDNLAVDIALKVAKPGSIKAKTMFLPHFLQTAWFDVNTSLSIFRPLAKHVPVRNVKASREAELAH